MPRSASCKSTEGLRTWVCYHVIGDALRRNGAPIAGFAGRFAARLAAEPTVLAPAAARPHGSRLPLAWAVAATVAAVVVVGWVAVSMLDPQPTAVAKAREANVVRAAQARAAAAVAGLPARAPGILADHADPGRRAVPARRWRRAACDGRP